MNDDIRQHVSGMPIFDYPERKTCVAFLDVSGFKQKMQEGTRNAAKFLDKFYRKMFETVRSYNTSDYMNGAQIRSLVMSDCSVIFVENSSLNEDKIRDVQIVLGFIRQINRKLITEEPDLPIMTTCSIDYGKFAYEDRIEFDGIEKEYFLGQPYINAVLDNENLKKYPSKCRVLADCSHLHLECQDDDPLLLLGGKRKHCYFYWMVNNRDSMTDFDMEYRAALRIKNVRKYEAIVRLVQTYINDRS